MIFSFLSISLVSDHVIIHLLQTSSFLNYIFPHTIHPYWLELYRSLPSSSYTKPILLGMCFFLFFYSPLSVITLSLTPCSFTSFFKQSIHPTEREPYRSRSQMLAFAWNRFNQASDSHVQPIFGRTANNALRFGDLP